MNLITLGEERSSLFGPSEEIRAASHLIDTSLAGQGPCAGSNVHGTRYSAKLYLKTFAVHFAIL
jgi:hypothetical protein